MDDLPDNRDWINELRRRLALVKVGAWAAICCEEDLHPIKTEEEAEQVREQIRDDMIELTYSMVPMVWKTKEEALAALIGR